MDLSTFANIAQLIQVVPVLLAFSIWAGLTPMPESRTQGRTRRPSRASDKKPPTLFLIAIAAVAISTLISAAALFERVGWWPKQKPEQIFNRNFINETVVIDNKEFYNCTFKNVEFRYGGGSYRFEKSTVTAPINLVSTDPKVTEAFALIDALDLLDRAKVKNTSRGPLP